MPKRTAVLTVDLNRGHLDPDVATLPVDSDVATDVIENTTQLTSAARDASVPVVHVSTEYRSPDELTCNPNVQKTNEGAREQILDHNMKGEPGVEVVSDVVSDGDVFVHPKKRYSPFLYGDLDFVLQSMDIERVLIAGVNTNTCVQCTCFEAYNRDFEVVVVEGCVGSMYGPGFHEWGLKNIDAALGEVVSLSEAVQRVGSTSVPISRSQSSSAVSPDRSV